MGKLIVIYLLILKTLLNFFLLFSDDFKVIISNLTSGDIIKTWQQFTASLNVAEIRRKNKNFDKSLRDVICADLWTLHYYLNKDAQALFYNLNNNLYTVNLDVSTSKGWNIATSMKLDLYDFNAPKGDAIIE